MDTKDQTSFLNIPFWGGCLCFLIGIACSYNNWLFFHLDFWSLNTLSLSLLCGGLFLWKFPPKSNLILSIGIGFIFMVLGNLRTEITKTTDQRKNEALAACKKDHGVHGVQKIHFQILKLQNKSLKYHNYIARTHLVNDLGSASDFILKVKSSKNNKHLLQGAWYAGWLNLQEIPKKSFSYGFDYAQYLNNQHIYHQCFVSNTEIIEVMPPTSNTINIRERIKEVIYSLHQKTRTSIEKLSMDKEVEAITKALILGDRSEISKSTKTYFKDAGIIHILAISGLHIGIVFGFWQYIFSWIIPKNQKVLQGISILLFLWMSVYFLGNSPSALRAGVMCSVFFLSKYQKNRQHPLNILCISVFLLVLYDPFLLFNVGFQLSVMAVMGICIGLPLWNVAFKIKNPFLKTLSGGIGVSISAQLGLLPLSLYYFNQFSGLFLIANIPILFLISTVFLLACLLSFGGVLWNTPTVLVRIYEISIQSMLYFAKWLSSFKTWVWKDIYIDSVQVMALYILLFVGLYIYLTKKYPKYFLSFLFVTTLASFKGLDVLPSFTKNELWLINKGSKTAIIHLNTDKIKVFTSSTDTSFSNQKFIQKNYLSPLQKAYKNSPVTFHDLQEYYLINQTPICFIDTQSATLNHENYCQKALLIFKEKTQVDLYEVIKKHQPKAIIALKGNYFTSRKKWRKDCKKLGIPYYEFGVNSALEIGDLL